MSEQKNTTVVDNTTENVTPNTDVQANPGQDHVAEQAIVAAAPTAVVQQTPVATTYITTLLSNMMDDFIAANAGLDVDFVYMGNWLVVDKKGNFIEKDKHKLRRPYRRSCRPGRKALELVGLAEQPRGRPAYRSL